MMKEGSMQEADFIDEAKTMMYLSYILFFLRHSSAGFPTREFLVGEF